MMHPRLSPAWLSPPRSLFLTAGILLLLCAGHPAMAAPGDAPSEPLSIHRRAPKPMPVLWRGRAVLSPAALRGSPRGVEQRPSEMKGFGTAPHGKRNDFLSRWLRRFDAHTPSFPQPSRQVLFCIWLT